MNPAQIKVKRIESVLMELIPESLQSLSDSRLRMIDVIEVVCSRGHSDAKVYMNPDGYTQKERNEVMRQLRKARPIIEEHCLRDQGWFRSPTLTFIFDEQIEKSKKIEDLFKQISKRNPEENIENVEVDDVNIGDNNES